MAVIEAIRIDIDRCSNGAYLRWCSNGWHYLAFPNRLILDKSSKDFGIQTVSRFSNISFKQRITSRDIKLNISMGRFGFTSRIFLTSLLYAELVEVYSNGVWVSIEIQRNSYTIRRSKSMKYGVEFTAKINGNVQLDDLANG